MTQPLTKECGLHAYHYKYSIKETIETGINRLFMAWIQLNAVLGPRFVLFSTHVYRDVIAIDVNVIGISLPIVLFSFHIVRIFTTGSCWDFSSHCTDIYIVLPFDE